MRYAQSRFHLDNPNVTFQGIHDPTKRWNGWAVPLFPTDEAQKIIETLPVVSEPKPVLVEGQAYYSIHSYEWCWEEVRD
jgi:hypothetical protein